MALHLSKSRYCGAVQCPKMLWLRQNRPEAFDESVMNQGVLETGTRVGDLARGLFGDYAQVPYDTDLGAMLRETERLMDAGVPVRGALLQRGYPEEPGGAPGGAVRGEELHLRQRHLL